MMLEPVPGVSLPVPTGGGRRAAGGGRQTVYVYVKL
jgi:hypothetical protein